MKIVADHTIPYLKGILEPYAEVVYLNASEFTPANVRDADILVVRSIDTCDRNLLEGSRVRLITTATIGYDHIDTAFCEANGIVWKNAPGCNAASVAQYVLSVWMLLSLQRGESLKGKTVGIVGVGHVGEQVARLAEVCGMKVLRNDPPRAEKEGGDGFVSLGEIAREADIVTLHTPLTREGKYPTFHLADASFFSSLQRSPWFINAARGGIHKTSALSEAKKKGDISALVLDCWEHEPVIDPELLGLTDIATPHIAGFSADGKSNATRMCLEHIARFMGVEIPEIASIHPPAPADPVIDLNCFSSQREKHAILQTFDPRPVDRLLRQAPDRFEWYRSHYNHPREFPAYTVINGQPGENLFLKTIGFLL